MLLAAALAFVPLSVAIAALPVRLPPVEMPTDGFPFVSAHRGGAAYAPENTMLAFHNAARLGVDDFETDTWLTADGALVLIHDQELGRTTNCVGPVTGKTWAQLQTCDAGWWFSPGQGTTVPATGAPHPARGLGVTIPSAKELFAFAASFQGRYQPTVTIELKDEIAAAREAEALVPLIAASGIQDRIVVQSFSKTGIDRVKQLDPAIRTLYLTAEKPGAWQALAAAVQGGHDFVSPAARMPEVNAAYAHAVHAAGRKLVPWTVDRRADLLRMMRIGADGVISNFPACLLQMQSRPASARLMPDELGAPDAPLCKP